MMTDKYTLTFRRKKTTPPIVKIEDAENGVIPIRTTKKTTKGVHKLVLEDMNGKDVITLSVEIT